MPAVLENARLEVLGANQSGRTLYDWLGNDFTLPFSIPRFMFLDPRALGFYPDWELMAHNAVAMLRAETAQDPHSAQLHSLIGQLATGSEPFRQLWAAHDVQRYRQAPKRFQHPAVGELEFLSESLDVARDEGLTLLTYTIEQGASIIESTLYTAEALSTGAGRDGHVRTTDSTVGSRVRIGSNDDGGFELAVQLEVLIPGLPREQAQALADAADRVCPYSNATRGNIQVDVTVSDD